LAFYPQDQNGIAPPIPNRKRASHAPPIKPPFLIVGEIARQTQMDEQWGFSSHATTPGRPCDNRGVEIRVISCAKKQIVATSSGNRQNSQYLPEMGMQVDVPGKSWNSGNPDFAG
jgi:hypothetical protein